MFDPKIKLSKNLYDKLKVAAEIMGCASVDEFVAKILETEADRILSQTAKGEVTAEDVEDIAKKLQGLGYLD